jgi:hypothetical protein
MTHTPKRRLLVPLVIAALGLFMVGVAHAQRATISAAMFRRHAASNQVTTTTVASATTSTTVAPTTTTVPPPTTTTTTAPPPPPPPPPPGPTLPTGKGMWIWQPQNADGGDPASIVARAQATGLTHIYVRTGSSVDGPTVGFLDVLLPVAHAAGLKVIGWDFPYLDDPALDADRAIDEILYTLPATGDRLDGFSADIETRHEGVALTADAAATYGAIIRAAVGPDYPLIATVPRPTPARQADYPYGEVTASFSAIAPMVYWINGPPVDPTVEALSFLSQFGKPVMPVGQAYDGSLEGGPPGTPTYHDLEVFIQVAASNGAAGVSFWSWQHASDDMWAAIAAGPEVGAQPPG